MNMFLEGVWGGQRRSALNAPVLAHHPNLLPIFATTYC